MDAKTFPSTSIHHLSEAIAQSGLVSEEVWSQVLASANSDPKELVRLLTTKGLLTNFQITALTEGRADSLRIGNYDILDRLGSGGMGTVFKARHRRMKRVVALKVLAASLSKNPIFVKRFQREVETIASLGHPNVVMAYDADEAELGHFLVMEFVDGVDLSVFVDHEGALPPNRAVNYILQTARGLAYAHSQGIIHRDIKPPNLLLDHRGNVKITDLGLARLNHGVEGPATGSDVTMAGGVIGTADYMSPEQAVDSTTIDHRADIYSLGCTLYFLLAGRPPFLGATIMAILLKHRDGEIPSLRELRHESPPQLEDLFRRMLAKKPEERIQQMSQVVTELEAIAALLPPDEPVQCGTAGTIEMSPGLEPSTASETTLQMPSATEVIETPLAPIPVLPITVLIVEPSRVQASIIKGYLQEHALTVVGTATNGNDAIEAVRKLRPRVVVAAMHLADRNGVELAQQIRSEFQTHAPGFLLITSETDGESASLSQLNRVLTLPKPFTAKQMIDALNLVTGASTPLPTTGKKKRDKLRVLIVDDSTPARMHVRAVLQSLGFSQFLECPDGAHAIAVAAREICDLIVTDYNMPLMDGRALVSYLKQNPATAAIPIVMVTTESDSRVLDPVRKLGVEAIIEKAFPASIVGPLLDSLF